MDEFIDNIAWNIDHLRELNEQKSAARSRELSVAITHFETGLLWAREAAKKAQVPA